MILQNIGQAVAKIITKKSILIFVLIAWAGFSIFYIVRDQWQRFQFNQIQVAYQKGVSDTIKLLISQAEKCAPVPVIDGDKKIEIIKVGCPRQETLPSAIPQSNL
ncbi:MAG: hypothetical protein AAB465_02575 [Patescibacteria group bacterium]